VSGTDDATSRDAMNSNTISSNAAGSDAVSGDERTRRRDDGAGRAMSTDSKATTDSDVPVGSESTSTPGTGADNGAATDSGAAAEGGVTADAVAGPAEEQAPADGESPAARKGSATGGTAPARKRGRFRSMKRWKKALVVVAVVLLVVSGGLVGTGWALAHRYESKVGHEDLLGDGAAPHAVVQQHFASGPLNLLLLGSDSRAGETGKGSVSGQRSDTIMLVHITAHRDKATVISIPRDSYVDVPAGGSWKGGMNKLNAAFAFGGAPLAAKTITKLTGVTLDGAMVANFAGIRTMVDVLGGVNVCVPYDVKSYFSAKVWTKGCHQMDGPTAEEFMRNRMYVPGGDFGRMKDQQLVVQGIIQKVSAQGILTNPLTLDRLLTTAAQSLTIDKTLNLQQLVNAARDIRPSAVTFATVPFIKDNLQTSAGSSVELDPKKMAAMFAAVRNDTIDQWIAANPPKPDA
jgi:LCP family protein required for cell wall assembly